MAAYYHIMAEPRPGVARKEIQKVLDLAITWFRYQDNCWIIHTTSDANAWYTRLEKLVNPGGNLLIIKLDLSDRQGWISKDLWKWLKKQ